MSVADVPGRTAGPLRIPHDLIAAMIDHCRREAPREACGLLGGVGDRVTSIHPLRNVRASETRYEADPQQLVAAVVALRDAKAGVQAIYHSHPRWAAIPSKVDLATNYWDETPRIIVSLLDEPPDVRMYALYSKSYRELPWKALFAWEKE